MRWVKHHTNNILLIRTGRIRRYICVCGTEKCSMLTRELHQHVLLCSSVKRPVIWHKVGEKPWPSDKLSNDFHTQTLAHTHIKEGEGQSARSMMEGENIHRGTGGEADIHGWHIQFLPLWMTGYSNWLVYIHSATEGWLKNSLTFAFFLLLM